jgi:hypothetical protein
MLLAFERRGIAVTKAAESHEIVQAALGMLLMAGGALLALAF